MPRRRSRRFHGLVAVAVVAIVVAAAVPLALPALGIWLVVADPLVPSDAIFVLEGRTPSREVEAAALYHRRLAPIVAVSRARDPQAIARRVARLPPIQHVAGSVLSTLGVPECAILLLEPEVRNTVEELAVIAEVARARAFRRVIVVTSPSHTRRVRMIWDARAAGLAALVHPTSYEMFDARRWWRSRHGLEVMAHELVGMANFKLGSLLPTFDEEEGRR